MQLPFTREQFFDLFVAYNEALWPAAVALWIASAVMLALRLSARRPHDRWISALLVAHWAWSALAYHVAFFTRITDDSCGSRARIRPAPAGTRARTL
jgi:hypothetical protein